MRVRELQTALSRAAAENTRLREENEMLKAHFDLAVLAAADLAALPEGGKLVIVDGWNMILGAQKAGCASPTPAASVRTGRTSSSAISSAWRDCGATFR